jgi:hypothetical protein
MVPTSLSPLEGRTLATRKKAGGRKRRSARSKKPIENYEHKERRLNNPPVGLVTPDTDPPETPLKRYAYDPGIGDLGCVLGSVR